MATISNTIALHDKMTPVLKSMTTALNMTLDVMQATDTTSTTAFTEIRRNIADAERALDNFNNELNDVPDNAKKAADGFTVLKGVVSNIVSNMVSGLGQALKSTVSDALETASNLVEVQNVVDVTFGESAAVINEWSKQALNAYGLNELSAKKYAGTMGAMLKSSGLTGEAINTMSMNMVALAGDMASFYNLTGEEAFAKIRAGISGETEPLKQLGINMTVANLEAYALSQGIKTAYGEMTQAQQATLRYNYLLQATADAQGDFVRTSDSYANQQKLLNENWQMFTANMATYLLPILTQVFIALNGLLDVLKPYAPILLGVTLGITGAVAAILLVTAATWLWNAAMAANPIVWVIGLVVLLIGVIGGLIAWIMDLWKTNVDFRVGVISIWNDILGFFDNVPLFFMQVGYGIADAFSYAKQASLNIMEAMANGIIDIINDVINMLNKIPGVAIEPLSALSFAAQAGAEEEAKRQSRADAVTAKKAEIAAIAAQRDAELAAYESSERAKQAAKQSAETEEAGVDWQAMMDQGVPINGGNLGSVDKIKGDVSITDEDIKFLKDVAALEYVNRYTTLRPEVQVTFGDVRETADVNQILVAIEDIIEEAYASSLVGEG